MMILISGNFGLTFWVKGDYKKNKNKNGNCKILKNRA